MSLKTSRRKGKELLPYLERISTRSSRCWNHCPIKSRSQISLVVSHGTGHVSWVQILHWFNPWWNNTLNCFMSGIILETHNVISLLVVNGWIKRFRHSISTSKIVLGIIWIFNTWYRSSSQNMAPFTETIPRQSRIFISPRLSLALLFNHKWFTVTLWMTLSKFAVIEPKLSQWLQICQQKLTCLVKATLAAFLGIQISQSPINGSLTLNCNGLVHFHTHSTLDFSS